jgi:copper chaperone CopZ
VSVAIKKVSGVDSVKVSLNEGLADIKLKDGNKVTVEQIRGIIRKNGFTPKESQARVAGNVVERNGQPALAVTGLDQVYLLADAPDAKGKVEQLKGRMGKQVVLSGQLPETKEAEEPQTLLVREVAPTSS